MSVAHPIIAVTGSSGAGTTSVTTGFEQIFRDQGIKPAMVSGDSFHLHTRAEFKQLVKRAPAPGEPLVSHFGPSGNDFKLLEQLFEKYSENGMGSHRKYLHNQREADYYNRHLNLELSPGEFTPFTDIPPGSDLLFYEGLHGMVQGENYDIARYVDFAVGVVPVINLEWIQKMYRDRFDRGHEAVDIVDTILRRMPDYVHHIVPQFSLTDINFQRVALVDTSNPFIADAIPTLDQSLIVIHFRRLEKFGTDLKQLLDAIYGSYLSNEDTLVIPGIAMSSAIEQICAPIVNDLVRNRD